jgi:hypothetical protein
MFEWPIGNQGGTAEFVFVPIGMKAFLYLFLKNTQEINESFTNIHKLKNVQTSMEVLLRYIMNKDPSN